jgi:hypothetical protein
MGAAHNPRRFNLTTAGPARPDRVQHRTAAPKATIRHQGTREVDPLRAHYVPTSALRVDGMERSEDGQLTNHLVGGGPPNRLRMRYRFGSYDYAVLI